MKKTTILAVPLVLLAAISAVWFVHERLGSEQDVSPVAHAVEPSLPGVSLPTADSPTVPVEAAPPRVSTPSDFTLGTFDSESPTPFLTDADLTVIERLEANRLAQVIFNRYTDQYVVRSRLVFLDRNAYEHMLAAIASGANEFEQPFALDVFPDKPCVISSFNHTLGGQRQQDFWSANSTCEGNVSEAWIYKGGGDLVFRVRSGGMDLRVVRLEGSRAYVAFEVVTHRQNPITTF